LEKTETAAHCGKNPERAAALLMAYLIPT